MTYLLTYNYPHRKTQDLLYRFRLAGVPLHVLATPWVERKNHVPLYKVKPDPIPYRPYQICEELGYDFSWIDSPDATNLVDNDLVVIAGAGLLSRAFVTANTVVNSHCGFLPLVRGLDALKWAIYYDQPIGVTTHIVDETCDAGRMIERKEVPLYPQDSLFSIAMRQYEMELDMLVEAIGQRKYKQTSEFDMPRCESTRRMPHSKELQMITRLQLRLDDLNE